MKTMTRVLLLLAFACAITGCPRHVVLDPAEAALRNDASWRIKRAPQAAPAPAAPQEPAPDML